MTNATKIIKKVIPTVVSIVISKSLEEIEKELPSELMPFFPFGVPEIKIPEERLIGRSIFRIPYLGWIKIIFTELTGV